MMCRMRAKLAVGARLRQLAQQILVHVALDVDAFVRGQIQIVDDLHHRAQRGPIVNLERGAIEQQLAGVRQPRQFVEVLDRVADRIEELIAGQRDEVAPREARPRAGEDALVLLVHHRQQIVLLGQQPQEDQVRQLLDGIHRVVDAARPENIHQPIDLLAQAG